MVESSAQRREPLRQRRTKLMKLLVGSATVVAAGLLTAGCSSGSGTKAAAASTVGATSTSATAAAGPSAGATSATATPSTGDKAAPVALCTTLPTAQVASLSGTVLTHSREQDFAAQNSYTCDYFTASGVGGMSVTVAVAGGTTTFANTLNSDTIAGPEEHVTPLTGLGDKAFSARDGVHALFGDRMIYVAGLTSVPQAEAIINALQAKLT